MKVFLSLFIIFFTIGTQHVTGQTRFIDEESKNGIPNIKLIGENGVILGLTDDNGTFYLSNKNKELSPKIKLEIYHPDYQYSVIHKEDIDKKKFIFLKKAKPIDEIIITAKKIYDYTVLKGYYMSYNLIDDVPVSFSDGIIEYFIPNKKLASVKSQLISCRYFVNEDFIKNYKKIKSGLTSIEIDGNILPFNFDDEILVNDWQNISINNEDLLRKNIKIGNIKSDDENITLNLVYNTPTNTEIKKLLGIQSEIINHTQIERFKKTENKALNIKNLLFVSRYYNNIITNKKLNSEINNKVFDEFHTLEVSQITKEEYQKLKKEVSTIGKTNYEQTPKFIKNNDKYPKIPIFIENLFEKELKSK